ncbi:MAG: sugar phosphate isomerase/epimerase, partial [Clostridia bacterium]
MRLSIRAHDLGVNGLDNVIDRLNTFCLDGAQMVAYKVIPEARYEKCGITEELARQINSAFTKANKQVVLIGAYFNPIHSNVDKAQRGKDVFKDYLAM